MGIFFAAGLPVDIFYFFIFPWVGFVTNIVKNRNKFTFSYQFFFLPAYNFFLLTFIQSSIELAQMFFDFCSSWTIFEIFWFDGWGFWASFFLIFRHFYPCFLIFFRPLYRDIQPFSIILAISFHRFWQFCLHFCPFRDFSPFF